MPPPALVPAIRPPELLARRLVRHEPARALPVYRVPRAVVHPPARRHVAPARALLMNAPHAAGAGALAGTRHGGRRLGAAVVGGDRRGEDEEQHEGQQQEGVEADDPWPDADGEAARRRPRRVGLLPGRRLHQQPRLIEATAAGAGGRTPGLPCRRRGDAHGHLDVELPRWPRPLQPELVSVLDLDG